MRKIIVSALLAAVATVAACSASDGANLGDSSGNAGGAGGAAPVSSKPDASLVLPDSGLVREAGSDSALFGDLFKSATFDPKAPCLSAFPWPRPFANIEIRPGDTVIDGGKLYEYVGAAMVAPQLLWTSEDTSPTGSKANHTYFEANWKDTGKTCP